MLRTAVVLFFVFVTFAALKEPLFAVETGEARSDGKPTEIPVPLTLLFTNDGHSSGNYAKLAAIIKQERQKAEEAGSAVVVVDAGDIAMGSVYQTLYSDHAFDYVAKALMGYDAITLGNHDFDFGISPFRQMLEAASASPYIKDASAGALLPHIVVSNLNTANPPHFEELGIKENIVLHKAVGAKNGEKRVSIGIYGLMGEHAFSCIANNDSLLFSDRIEAAEKAVEALKEQNVDYIILLSHGGTLWAKGKKVGSGAEGYEKLKSLTEDGKIACSIAGTDVIISGHDHELLKEPLVFGHTVIGSAGSKNCFLGKIVMVGDSLVEYSVIPVGDICIAEESPDGGNPEDAGMRQYLRESYTRVSEKFLNLCGIALDDTIAVAERKLPLEIDSQGNMELGFYIADSYRSAAQCAVEAPVAIVPYGVVRKEIDAGAVTVADAFESLSLGMGQDGTPGYPLVLVWVTGKELYDICELNASVAWGMEDARLFFSGMEFRYNRFRIPFTKVTEVKVNGKPVEKKELYPVVTGLYTAQLMEMLKSSSFGLLSVAPKNADGTPMSDFSSSLLKCRKESSNSAAISEWQAFAEYIKKTELKNPAEKCSMENSTPSIYLKYSLILLIISVPAVLLLRSGRRARCRRH